MVYEEAPTYQGNYAKTLGMMMRNWYRDTLYCVFAAAYLYATKPNHYMNTSRCSHGTAVPGCKRAGGKQKGYGLC